MNGALQLSDLIPKEVISKPLTHDAYYKEVRSFVGFAALLGCGLALSGALFIAGIIWSILLLAVFPFMFAVLLLVLLLQLWDTHIRARKDIEVQRTNDRRISILALEIYQNFQIDKVVVQKGGAFVQGNVPQAPALPSVQPPRVNDYYDLALKIAEVGINAWNDNGGKRPRPKPISANAITELFKVGRDSWQEAIGLLAESCVMEKPEDAMWTPLCRTSEEAKQVLDSYLQRQGFFRTVHQKREVWMTVKG